MFWPLDKAYYPETVQSGNQSLGKFKLLYDDGEKEKVQISKEEWLFADTNQAEVNIIEPCKATYPRFKMQEDRKLSVSLPGAYVR